MCKPVLELLGLLASVIDSFVKRFGYLRVDTKSDNTFECFKYNRICECFVNSKPVIFLLVYYRKATRYEIRYGVLHRYGVALYYKGYTQQFFFCDLRVIFRITDLF